MLKKIQCNLHQFCELHRPLEDFDKTGMVLDKCLYTHWKLGKKTEYPNRNSRVKGEAPNVAM